MTDVIVYWVRTVNLVWVFFRDKSFFLGENGEKNIETYNEDGDSDEDTGFSYITHNWFRY